jgi:regulator of sigma E protease
VLDPVFLLVAIVSLGFLIVVHEGGHYFVARWCRMRIDLFSIGFGPGLLKRTSRKTGTTFQLAPIPFGGFVQIRGMNIAEEVDPDDKLAYPNRPVWQRFLTIFAGPATNYLSAIVLAMLLYTCHGSDVPKWYGVGAVLKDYDAYGKLEHGDRIVAVDHKPLEWSNGDELIQRVKAANGAPITLSIERDGQPREVIVKPRQDKDASGNTLWRIGVQPYAQTVTVDIGVVNAARAAIQFPIDESRWIGKTLYGIVFGSEKADPGGPVRMVEEFYHAFSAGIAHGIFLLMRLSVYLGLFNLLPIPALDGGRLVFLIYEMVTRRRANPKVETMVHMTGIMALGVVMILVLFVDLKRFF